MKHLLLPCYDGGGTQAPAEALRGPFDGANVEGIVVSDIYSASILKDHEARLSVYCSVSLRIIGFGLAYSHKYNPTL